MMSSIQKEFQRLKMRLKQENDHHEPSDLHHHQIHHQQIQTSKMSQSQITQVSSPHRSQVNVRSRITNANLIDTRRQEYNPRHLRIDQQQQQQIEHNSSVINAQCLSPRPRPRDCKL